MAFNFNKRAMINHLNKRGVSFVIVEEIQIFYNFAQFLVNRSDAAPITQLQKMTRTKSVRDTLQLFTFQLLKEYSKHLKIKTSSKESKGSLIEKILDHNP